MRGHVDAESLALYAEGELSRGRTARVRVHLSGCPECGATLAALGEVTTQLSHVPAPPMPPAVAARLDAALSAEVAHRAAAAAPAPAGAPPRPPRRNPIWSPVALRVLAAAGATLVVAGGVGYAISQSSVSSSSSGTSGTARSAAPVPRHRTVQGAPFMSPGGAEKPSTGSSSHPVYTRTGTDYQPGTLATQARKKLAGYTVPGISAPGIMRPAQIPAGVHDCVSRIAAGRPVRVVDLARYQQRPAIVIVLGNDQVIAASYGCTPLHSARLTGRG